MSVPVIRVIDAPEAEPVTLTQAKAWLRVDHSDEDATIELLITAARERAEELTGRVFVQRRLEMRLDAFPAGNVIEIPHPPLIAVNSVSYIDGSGDLQTLSGSPSEWIEDTVSAPGRIQTLQGESWPATRDEIGAVRIDFTCGYAPEAGSPADWGSNVPALVKQWMQVRLGTFYMQREALVIGQSVTQPPRDFVDGLLDNLNVRLGFA